MVQKVQAAGVNDQTFEILEKTFEEALKKENIVLSRPERERLLSQVSKLVLEDMLKKL